MPLPVSELSKYVPNLYNQNYGTLAKSVEVLSKNYRTYIDLKKIITSGVSVTDEILNDYAKYDSIVSSAISTIKTEALRIISDIHSRVEANNHTTQDILVADTIRVIVTTLAEAGEITDQNLIDTLLTKIDYILRRGNELIAETKTDYIARTEYDEDGNEVEVKHYEIRVEGDALILKPLLPYDRIMPIPEGVISKYFLRLSRVRRIKLDLPENWKTVTVDEITADMFYKPVRVLAVVQQMKNKEPRLVKFYIKTKDGYERFAQVFPYLKIQDPEGRELKVVASSDNTVEIESQEGVLFVPFDVANKSLTPSSSIQFIVEGDLVDKLIISRKYVFDAIPIPKYRVGYKRGKMLYVTGAREYAESMVKITEEDIKKFKKFKGSIMPIVQSFAPHIPINSREIFLMKLAALLAIVRGSSDDESVRDMIHVLGIGDPSTGKTDIFKWVLKIDPGSTYVSGKGASGAGLTVSTVRGPDGWEVKIGRIPLANGHTVLIDEFDKLDPTDRDVLYEAMEDGKISLAKAGINTMIEAKTSVIGLANPSAGTVMGKDLATILGELGLPGALVSRFDIILIIPDKVDKEKDYQAAISMIRRYRGEIPEPPLSEDELRKFIHYVRKKKVTIPAELEDYAAKKFVELREMIDDDRFRIRLRNFNSALRIASALAKLKQEEVVTKEDIDMALELVSLTLDNQKSLLLRKFVTPDNIRRELRQVLGILKGNTVTLDEIVRELINVGNYDSKLEGEIRKVVEKILEESEFQKKVKKVKSLGDDEVRFVIQ